MKHLLLTAILKSCAKALLLTLMIVVLIGVIGYIQRWDTSLAYSNAFFLAGCLMFIGGGFSRLAAGQDWRHAQQVHAETFREMSGGERTDFILEVSNSFNLMILGMVSGVLLVLLSLAVIRIF